MRKTKLSLTLGLLLSGSAMTAQASLISTDGGLGVYDSATNITFTSDANLLGTLEAANSGLIATIVSDEATAINTAYSHTLTSGEFGSNGLVDWYGAQAYVAYLNKINYGNSDQWALPSAGSSPATGNYQTGSQLGELYYNELNGRAYPTVNYDILGTGTLSDTSGTAGPFSNVHTHAYWSGTEYASNANNAWYFGADTGYQTDVSKAGQFMVSLYAWAVSPGQVTASSSSAVPEPGIISLMLVGLLGLTATRREQAG
jgi:hypothetical protein